jgi:hypothetical protein
MGLFEMIDLADMHRGLSRLKAYALAMPAGREVLPLGDLDLDRHVGMHRIVGNRVNAGLRHDLAQLERFDKLLSHARKWGSKILDAPVSEWDRLLESPFLQKRCPSLTT